MLDKYVGILHQLVNISIDMLCFELEAHPESNELISQLSRFADAQKYLERGILMPEISISNIMYTKFHGRYLLNRLLQPGQNPKLFSECLALLKISQASLFISYQEYKSFLTEPPCVGVSILHGLMSQGDIKNLENYLADIDAIWKLSRADRNQYLALFTFENRHGYSVMHQAINAPNFQIATTFMKWFEKNQILSPHAKQTLLRYNSQTCLYPQINAQHYPKRTAEKEGSNIINTILAAWRNNPHSINSDLRNNQEQSHPLIQQEESLYRFMR